MAKLTVKGVPGLDGEYEFDESYFTNRELHLIKRETGLRAGEFEDAYKSGDTDVMVALAMVAVTRAGKGSIADRFWDAQPSTLAFDFSDAEEGEDDAVPPVSAPVALVVANGISQSSGHGSGYGGASLESVPSPTGAPV